MNKKKNFKTCPRCSFSWDSRKAFLADPKLELKRYKADLKAPQYGMFFFTHQTASCSSTITMLVNDFRSLYPGKISPKNKAFSEDCPGYCLEETQLARCDVSCQCAFARDIVQILLGKHEQEKEADLEDMDFEESFAT